MSTLPDFRARARMEAPLQHRAMLLTYLLRPTQTGANSYDPRSRPSEHVLEALKAGGQGSLTPSHLEQWQRGFTWSARAERQGVNYERDALALYYHMYFDEYGHTELAALAPYAKLDVLLDPRAKASPLPLPELPKDPVQALASTMNGGPLQAIAKADENALRQEAKANKAAEYQRRNIMRMERTIAIADKALAHFESAFDKGEVKFRVADLATLNNVARETLNEMYDVAAKADAVTQGVVVDSVRVKLAKQAGSSVMRAVIEDMKELLVIAEHLAAAEAEGDDYEDAIEVG